MKFSADIRELKKAIDTAIAAVSARPTNPVLTNFLLVAEENLITLTGFDLSLGIRALANADVEEMGKVCIPARLLKEIVGHLPDGRLVFSCDENGALATISTLSGSYELHGMSAEDYPAMPTIEDETEMTLRPDELREALGAVLYAASTDETKQILVGVNFTQGENGLDLATTDGHRLAVAETCNGAANVETVTIPANALGQVAKALAGKEDPIEIAVGSSKKGFAASAQFCLSDVEIYTRVLDGAYPAYRQLLPKDFSMTVTADRKALLTALGRAKVIADRKNNIVKLSIDKASASLQISVDATDVGSCKESMKLGPIVSEDEELIIAFNVKYLVEALGALRTSEVQIQFNSPTSPAVISPIGGEASCHLVMPVQIRD